MNRSAGIQKALERFDEFRIPDSPPERLALTEELAAQYKKSSPFADVDVLFVQHHLGPFIGRLNAMMDCGLDPGRSWFVDIPYSTSHKVVEKLVQIGFPQSQMTRKYDDPLSDYGAAQAQRIQLLMQALESRKNPKPLLVIDDGGYFLRHMKSLENRSPERMKSYFNTCVVEQTTRGHRVLCNDAIHIIAGCRMKAVSIARCETKKDFEGPFIGAAVSRALKRRVGQQRLSGTRRIGVIGFGVVGEATVQKLFQACRDAHIHVIDNDAKARERVCRLAADHSKTCRGLSHFPDKVEYEVIFGCTGYNSFHLDQRSLLANDAVLVSGSSAAVEFNRAGFVELADRYGDDEIEIVDRPGTLAKGIHADIRIKQEGGKCFSFLNAGFPANFDGKLECLPEKIIQATHGLLFMAGIQALKQPGPGIHAIDPETDRSIFDMALRDLENPTP